MNKKIKTWKDLRMACQKVCKQVRDDAWKQRSHSYIFFTLQLGRMLESWICSHPCSLLVLCIHVSIWVLHTDYYDHSALHSSSGSSLYQSHVYSATVNTDLWYWVLHTDSVIKVRGMAHLQATFLLPHGPGARLVWSSSICIASVV